MFVIFEIPLADARTFLAKDSPSLLPYVNPPNDPNYTYFTRSFGETQKRGQGGVQNWPNENFFGQSKRGLRFKSRLGDHILGPDYSKNTIKWVSRRLFHSSVIARLEIDFSFSGHPKDAPAFKQTLIDLLNLDVRIPHINDQNNVVQKGEINAPLKDVSSAVALRLLYSTTRHGDVPSQWWISAAEPFLIVELDKKYIPLLPKDAVHISRFQKFDTDIYYFKLQVVPYPHIRNIEVWILFSSHQNISGEYRTILRNFRLNISRFITERRCLQIFLSHIANQRIKLEKQGQNIELLETYLKKSLDLIESGKGLNLSKTTRSHLILAMVRQMDDFIHPGDYVSIIDELTLAHDRTEQIKRIIETQTSPKSLINFFLAINSVVGSNIKNVIAGKSHNLTSVSLGDVGRKLETSTDKLSESFNSNQLNYQESTMSKSIQDSVMGSNIKNVIAGKIHNLTGVNLGDVSGNVRIAIGNLSESSDSSQSSLKELLFQLQNAIEAEAELKTEDKIEALEQLEVLAKAGQNPEDSLLKKSAKTALKIINGTIHELPTMTKLVEECAKLIPAVTSLLGLI